MKKKWIVLLVIGLVLASPLYASSEAVDTAVSEGISAVPESLGTVPDSQAGVLQASVVDPPGSAAVDAQGNVAECQPVGGYIDEETLDTYDLGTMSSAALTELGLTSLGLGDPIVYASTCNISLNCGDGNVVSCAGNYSCSKSAGQCLVKCDGVQHECPNTCRVFSGCGGGGAVFCSSCSGDCQSGNESVTCNGTTYNCPDIPGPF